jgi:outer membrane protein assembly factor BamB
MHGFPKSILTLTLPLLLPAALRAEDWPQWRGPNRDGARGETGILQTFPAEGLNVRWRVPAGWGFASPVVAHGHVFLADSEMMKPKARERLRCFDESTGNTLWTHAYDVAYEAWALDPTQEIGPVATPIVRAGRVMPFGGRKVAWSPPAYANHHIFARNGKELICASLAVKP